MEGVYSSMHQSCESNKLRSIALKGEYFPHKDGNYHPSIFVRCSTCGKIFRKKYSMAQRVKRHFCSRECNATTIKSGTKPWNYGQSNPIVERTCPQCGKIFKVRGAGRIKNAPHPPDIIYCSPKCARPHLSEGVTYKSKSRFRFEAYYGPEWKVVKRKVLGEERVCRVCSDEGDADADHVVPFDFFSDHQLANARENLWRLCDRCHGIKTRYEDRVGAQSKEWWVDFIRKTISGNLV